MRDQVELVKIHYMRLQVVPGGMGWLVQVEWALAVLRGWLVRLLERATCQVLLSHT